MPDYGLRYVGADRLPGRLTEFDLQQNFRLSSRDVEAIKTARKEVRIIGSLWSADNRGKVRAKAVVAEHSPVCNEG